MMEELKDKIYWKIREIEQEGDFEKYKESWKVKLEVLNEIMEMIEEIEYKNR
ncbi:MAG: hypothetical protein LBG52_04860 [Candidatus Peribacteria bacterium]|jgi:hypothetical protein|nr:hypothetical protein [Candidatus Peribacteria bacterium]